MKKLLLYTMLPLFFASSARSQDDGDEPRSLRRDALTDSTVTVPSSEMSSATLTPTPEMWLYTQERSRYEDPKAAVRRRAEFRAAQRQYRLASQQWYGISNSRPTASPTPWFGTYSPMWASNSFDPYRWRVGTVPYSINVWSESGSR